MFAAKIQNDLRILTERLARINDNLARKVSSRTEYDKTITETESCRVRTLVSRKEAAKTGAEASISRLYQPPLPDRP